MGFYFESWAANQRSGYVGVMGAGSLGFFVKSPVGRKPAGDFRFFFLAISDFPRPKAKLNGHLRIVTLPSIRDIMSPLFFSKKVRFGDIMSPDSPRFSTLRHPYAGKMLPTVLWSQTSRL